MASESDRWRELAALANGIMLRLTLWISASAVLPVLSKLWGLDAGGQTGLTVSVQLGFITGLLLSAILNLVDGMSTRLLIVISALLGVTTNAAVALLADSGLFFYYLSCINRFSRVSIGVVNEFSISVDAREASLKVFNTFWFYFKG
jgi:hypothetical protein